ncbi:MAG: hypothetical protein CK425_10745 [Parachlamydia sp.]|nr:MAG: hypothetical protein CK425_10745 [Parachlamydia sp.]
MSHIYIISFNDLSINKKVFINTDHKIETKEIQALKHRHAQIKALATSTLHADKKIITLDLKDLLLEHPLMDTAGIAPPIISVNEIAVGDLKKLRGPALITRLESLLDSKPAHIPVVQLIWKMLLGPLLIIGRFMEKNRDMALRNLRDLDRGFNYDSAGDYLNDYQTHLDSLISQIGKEDPSRFKDLRLHLEDMQQNGQILRSALENKEKNFIGDTAQALAAKAWGKFETAENNKETSLLSFPSGFYQNGKYQPMLATLFVDNNKKIRLELNTLGSSQSKDLQKTYRFDAPSQKNLVEVVHGLCILSTNEKSARPVRLSRREKIRIKVTRQFNVDQTAEEAKATPHSGTFKPALWLHENLATAGGIPLKNTSPEKASNRTLTGVIGSDLDHFFTEVPIQEKVGFLVKLVEEHYEAYLKAHPYLTAAQQDHQLQLLKFKIKKLEDHLIKRMGTTEYAALRKTHQTFDLFFQKIDQLQTAHKNVITTRILKKDREIDRSLRKSAGTFSYCAVDLAKVKPLVFSKKTTSAKTLEVYTPEINQLQEAIQTNQKQAALEQLTSLQQKIDKLIDKKSYLEAKELSIRVLQTLPVPSDDPNNFWKKAPLSFTNQIADLNKHIWESSLRLKDQAPSSDQLIQMIKSQVIIGKVAKVGLDQKDLMNIIMLHPHYRFGWLPEQQAEINQIVACLRKDFQKQDKRYDLRDKGIPSLSFTKNAVSAHGYVAQARVQFMTACLMKPDYTIYPFYGKGIVGTGAGVNYLDWLVKEAINKGAKTPKEKSEMIKAIKYEDMQKRLGAMGRLEMEYDEFVTMTECVKIFDRSFFGRDALCYMASPWAGRAMGLDQYEKKYHFSNDQSNTTGLTGVLRGEEVYLGEHDAEEIGVEGQPLKTHPMKKHLRTLTPQKGHTEPSLLSVNLQRDPRGQISQVSNYIIESSQVAINTALSYQTVYESLNLIRTQSYLINAPEFQRTILQNISRPGFLTTAIEKNPLFFENFSQDLLCMIPDQTSGGAPFLILLGYILQTHAQEVKKNYPSPQLDSIIQTLPSSDTSLKIGDASKPVHTWLNEWLTDEDKDLGTVALALLYLAYQKPMEAYSPQDFARLAHACSIFEATGDAISIPQFNAELKKWILAQLTPHLQQKCTAHDDFRNHFADEWIRLATNNPTYSSMNWKVQKELFDNQDFTIDLKNFQIRAKKKTQRLAGQEITLPHAVSRSVGALFGSETIKATLRKGNTPAVSYYEFTYKNENYRISHNQESSDVNVYRELPLDLKKPNGRKEWFQHLPQRSVEGEELSALEQMVVKNGLWVNVKNTRQAYVYPNPPKEDSNKHGYAIKLDPKGKILEAKDPLSSLYVVLDKRGALSQVASFANPNQTLFLAKSKRGQVTEMRFLQDNSLLKRKGREWQYVNEKLGEGYKWLTDLSPAKLLLKDKSSAKAFLDSFDGMHEKFILPVSNGKVHTFIIQPYGIQRHKGMAKVVFDHNVNILPENTPPLTITFDSQGKQEGNPSAFIYLAYYFAHTKNYRMAEHYLDLAKKAANTSGTEAQVLDNLESLFENDGVASLQGAAFQLKAQLAIKHIKSTQLGQTVYTPANSGEFLDNLLHMAKLYRIYQKRENELKEGALTAEELFQVKHYVQMSMIDYIEKFQETAAITEQTLGVNYSQFEYFKPKQAPTPPDMLTVLLMSADLKKHLGVDELVKQKLPNSEYIIRHFFNFAFAILEAQQNNPEELEKLKLFLQAPKAWEIQKTVETDEHLKMAQFACQYLELLSLSSPKKVNVPKMRDTLIKARRRLPYFARNLGVISTIFDALFSGQIYKVANTQNSIKSILGSLIDEPIEFPKDYKGTFDSTKEGKHMTSLQAVLDVLAAKPASLSPLEQSKITEMIKSGDFDLNEPRELLTLLRESEAREFSVLEVRSETENLRQINHLEKEIAARTPPQSEALTPLYFAAIAAEFTAIKSQFPSPLAPADSKLLQQKASLQHKAARLETYFTDKPKIKKTHAEENRQLKIGLELAGEKLQAEMERKASFSKKEIESLKKLVCDQTNAMGKNEIAARTKLLADIKQHANLPDNLKKMAAHPEIYTEYEFLNEVFKTYKKLESAKSIETFEGQITDYLLLSSAYQQMQKAKDLLSGEEVDSLNAAKALQMVHTGLNEKRFEQAGTNGLITRICLVAEARDGIVYRLSQLRTIKAFSENPNRWDSLIMGEGKTSYITPTIAEVLAEQGSLVVITVPETLLKGNRQSFDKASRSLFDQAGAEFSIPLTEHLPHNLLAEKYVQLLKIVKERGYIVTSVEELCSLHNLIIQLEDEKLKLSANPMENMHKIFFVEKRLHYLRKISRLLHGEAEELKVKTQFFGDEVDTTHDISHEVNLAIGSISPPNKTVRDVTRTLFEMILTAKAPHPLQGLKMSLLQDAQSVRTKAELENFMEEAAKALQANPKFLEFLGKDQAKVVQGIPPNDWAGYLTGSSNVRPAALGPWNEADPSLKYIASAKQLLNTFKGMLSMKTGNEFGLSDYNGFMNVPKTMKNEAKGMRFGDEFELIIAQYIGYLEYLSAQSLTDESERFLIQALKTFQNKYPTKYDHLIEDYAKSQSGKSDAERLTLVQYFKTPLAWKHRFEILDEIVFDSGYITRFNQQISTNVQEVFHGKNIGGITGTLDPYTLPYISDAIQFNQAAGDKKVSTREVEAETLLRMTLNLPEGIDTKVGIYDDENPMPHLCENILGNKLAKAFINNSGATSEGMDILAWIESLRQTPEGNARPYLFRHPKFGTTYLWLPGAKEPAAYKGQLLPDNCLTLYAPNDTRGVDQPIGSGEVHFYIGATTPLAEFMQTLFRARRIGADHKVFLHIPKTWAAQIKAADPNKGITYGDIATYIVNRTADTKEGINETAQLEKIMGQLKMVVSRYLRQTNPEFDQIEFWDEANFQKFGMYVLQETQIFSQLRTLYIKNKEIQFATLYEPMQKIAGTTKILDAYDNLGKEIDDLIGKLAAFSGNPLQGKTDLVADLQKLKADVIEQKKHMQLKVVDHERFLPEETTKAAGTGKGVKEQVKELEQEKTKTKEVQEEDPTARIDLPPDEMRSYIPVDLNGLFVPSGNIYAPQPLTGAFAGFNMSLEAAEVMQKIGIHRGDPLLYLVVAKEPANAKPTMTFVGKRDYHQVIFEALRHNQLKGRELQVFSVKPDGFSQIDGTSKVDSAALPADAIAFKCYLGIKEYDPKELPKLKKWLHSLSNAQQNELNLFLKEKCTQTLYDVVQEQI